MRNGRNLYAAGVDRHSCDSDGRKRPFFEAAADNDSMPTTVLADDEYVYFATDQGNVVWMSAAGEPTAMAV